MPSATFAGDGALDYRVTLPPADKWWIGLEKFVPATDAPSGGTWTTMATPATFLTFPSNDLSFSITPGAGGNYVNVDLEGASDTFIRVTFIPIGGEFGYDAWADPADAIEPERGSYLRFYHYGTNYVYRKPLPKK
jgi:hypothetical protein